MIMQLTSLNIPVNIPVAKGGLESTQASAIKFSFPNKLLLSHICMTDVWSCSVKKKTRVRRFQMQLFSAILRRLARLVSTNRRPSESVTAKRQLVVCRRLNCEISAKQGLPNPGIQWIDQREYQFFFKFQYNVYLHTPYDACWGFWC